MFVYDLLFFFFQAEDGIRDYKVTGVQTCALPICERTGREPLAARYHDEVVSRLGQPYGESGVAVAARVVVLRLGDLEARAEQEGVRIEGVRREIDGDRLARPAREPPLLGVGAFRGKQSVAPRERVAYRVAYGDRALPLRGEGARAECEHGHQSPRLHDASQSAGANRRAQSRRRRPRGRPRRGRRERGPSRRARRRRRSPLTARVHRAYAPARRRSCDHPPTRTPRARGPTRPRPRGTSATPACGTRTVP